MELQLRHLRNLCAVADAGSLNKAAAELGLPQPALSRQIRRLEGLLGGALFQRGTCGVQLTSLGESVLGHAETIIQRFDDLDEQLRTHQQRQRRTLRVGWDAGPLSEALLGCLWQLRPDGQLRIMTVQSSQELSGLVRAGEVDIALFNSSAEGRRLLAPGLATNLVADTPVLLAMADSHPLARVPGLSMTDLADEEWISVLGPDGCQEVLRALCSPFGFDPKISYDVPVSGPRCDVIRHQGCVSLTQQLRPIAPGIVYRKLIDLPWRSQHWLAALPGNAASALLPALSRLLSAAHDKLVRERATVTRAAGMPTTPISHRPATFTPPLSRASLWHSRTSACHDP
ncbi:LysR family transcriptional regulator [Streptomyces zagrosensis]|uniref:DNA-binding transcriptional LysR family regulator n=1 Tax=Streptomyces zagrosensis TaxID=1042984 RepID=A0A7W9Q922_9ACTN|nr:LysR family transcriptional regulator [Streptomyces zagrosensis]MBB5935860.1 DNA-binding transcriptional LysR family regulator [Streptomyces zagrosensis]